MGADKLLDDVGQEAAVRSGVVPITGDPATVNRRYRPRR
jgi:hypothetical protein